MPPSGARMQMQTGTAGSGEVFHLYEEIFPVLLPDILPNSGNNNA